MKYKELPINHVKFSIEKGWCGDEQCNCHYIDIYSIKDDTRQTHLWQSDYISISYGSGYERDMEELKLHISEAFNHYCIKINYFGDSFWDWEIADG